MYYDIKWELGSQIDHIYHETYEIFKIGYVNYFEDTCEKYHYLNRVASISLKEIDSNTYYKYIVEEDDYIFCNNDKCSEETNNKSKDKLKI